MIEWARAFKAQEQDHVLKSDELIRLLSHNMLNCLLQV